MAGAKPGVHVVQLKPILVPKSLEDGAKFIKWDDDSGQATPVTLRVDKNGFFLYWTDQNKETEFLEISCIRDTRTGRYARTPKRTKPDVDPKLQYYTNIGSQDIPMEDKTVTIVYGPDFVNANFLNFCCDRREIAKEWTDELLRMAYNLLALNASSITFLLKAHTKIILSTDKDGKIPIKNVMKMFAQNREDKKRVEKALEATGLSSGKNELICPSKFTFDDFLIFYKHLTGRGEAEKIFEELCRSGSGSGKSRSYMLHDQLVNFLNHQQRDPRLNEILYPYVTDNRAKDIIRQYEPNKYSADKGHLSFDGFLRYLMSDDNAIVAPEKFDLNEDMTQPLPHYFINSSHNTYLTGHQLTGKSSVEIYRQCLLAGCRCVELDCWNGKTSEDEPIVTHGFTVVTDVNFKDVIEAIAESAFKTSEYPVILSFENHCSPKIQAKMAQYCRKIFGEALLADPLTSHPVLPGHPLPSPAQLLRKIIIKNKKKHYHNRGSNNGSTGNGEVRPGGGGHAPTQAAVMATLVGDGKIEVSPTRRLHKSNSKDSQGGGSEGAINLNGGGGGVVIGEGVVVDVLAPNGDLDIDSPSESDSEDDDFAAIAGQIERKESADTETFYSYEKGTAGKESEAGAEMSAMVNYIQPVHFHSFEVSEKRHRSYEISSFVETSATNLLKEHPVDFVNYNKRQLSRIYPKGTRVDSSNYMPQVFWNAGCQLVALNFQTLDLAMQLNMGIFEYNGRSGYLQKPDFMRRHDRRFDPFAESTVDGIIAGSLSVKIISGQFLSDKRVTTYVEVESYGLPADTVRKKFRSKMVPNNGINPVYDEEPFIFKKVVLPDLCGIRFVVCEEGGKMIGHRVLPVVGLRPGYRHIALRNESGQPLALPLLFVYITVKDYVPEKLSDIADALVNPIKYQSELEKRAEQLSALTDDFDEGDDDSDIPRKSKQERTPIKSASTSLDGAKSRSVKNTSSLDSGGIVSGCVKEDGTFGGASGSYTGGSSLGSSSPMTSDWQSGGDVPKRKDSRKGNHSTKLGDISIEIQNTSFEVPDCLITAEPLEKIKDNKIVQCAVLKLEKEIQTLKKRHDKLKSKTKDSLHKEEEKFEKQKIKGCKSLSKIRKSSVSVETTTTTKRQSESSFTDTDQESKWQELQRTHSETLLSLHQDCNKTELELQRKCHEHIYVTIDKCLQTSQALQLKTLEDYFNNHEEEVKRRLTAERAEEIRALKKIHRDKNERARMKREIQQKHINQAVAELQKVKENFETKKRELERQQEEIRKKLDDDKEKAWDKVQRQFGDEIALIQETLRAQATAGHSDKSPSPMKEVTAL